MLGADFKIVESEKTIAKRINDILQKQINQNINKVAVQSTYAVRQLISDAIKTQPEYISLDSGKLSAEFGLTDGKQRMDEIINELTKTIIIHTIKPTAMSGSKISTGFQIIGIRPDFENILGMEAATLITENGQGLPWLQWLLLMGDRTILRDYRIQYNPRAGKSRTGKAIMVPQAGRKWHVPTEFAGTQTNNMITRALDSIDNELQTLLINNIIKYI